MALFRDGNSPSVCEAVLIQLLWCLLANVVAAAVTVVVIVVIVATAATAAAVAAEEPEYEKDDDNPAAVTAIANIKSTVHKDISFK